MSFRLVPKSVTLNDLERRNGPYIALFHRDLDYMLIVSTMQSRDTMSNFATEQQLCLKLLIYRKV